MTTPTPLLLTPAEAADRLRLGRTSTYEMLRRGELPSIRIGRSVRVPVKALEGWIASKEQPRSVALPEAA